MLKKKLLSCVVLILSILGNMSATSVMASDNIGSWLYKDFETSESVSKTSGVTVSRITDDTYNSSVGALSVKVTEKNGSPEFYMNCKANVRYRINLKIKVLQDMKLDKIKFIFFAKQTGATTLKNAQITNTNIKYLTNQWIDYSTTYFCTGKMDNVDVEEYNKVQLRLGDGTIADSVSTSSIDYIIDDFSILPIADDDLNIIKNGDFDSSINSTISNWNKSNVTATALQDGVNSFKYVEVTLNDTNGTFWQSVAFEQGKTYNISFYAKADSKGTTLGQNVILYVDLSQCKDSNGNAKTSDKYIALKDSSHTTLTNDWVKYSMTYTHNLDTSIYSQGSPKIYTAIGDRSKSTACCLDEFSITEASASLTPDASCIFTGVGSVKANLVGFDVNEDVAVLALYNDDIFVGAATKTVDGDGVVSISTQSQEATASQFMMWKNTSISPIINTITCN